MGASYDSLFAEHLAGGHPGLVQTSIAQAPVPFNEDGTVILDRVTGCHP
jgi:hypothetical protein